MGIITSKFKKKTTIELLEDIDHEIKKINEIRDFNNLKFKKYYIKLLLFSTVIMLIGLGCLYFNYSTEFRIYVITFMISIPFIVWAIKNLMYLYFENYKSTSDVRVKELIKKKTEILNNIKETETYKNAIEILKKFDKLSAERSLQSIPPNGSNHTGNTSMQQKQNQLNTPLSKSINGTLKQSSLIKPLAITNSSAVLSAKCRTPRPILPVSYINLQNNSALPSTEKGVLDRLIEYFLQDGNAQYRYALICNACHGHNGMAIREEFEYIAFRCPYCNHFNPARKHKPKAPTLDHTPSFHSTREEDKSHNEIGLVNTNQIDHLPNENTDFKYPNSD